jgi:hypothetical protein
MQKPVFVLLFTVMISTACWATPPLTTAPGASTAYVDAGLALKLPTSTTYGQSGTVFMAPAATSGYATMAALTDSHLPAASNAAAIALKLTIPSGTSNTVYAGGATTNTAAPSMRALVSADIPPDLDLGNSTGTSLILTGQGTGTSQVIFMTAGTTTNAINADVRQAYVVQQGGGPAQVGDAVLGASMCFINDTGITSVLTAYSSTGASQVFTYKGADSTGDPAKISTSGALGDGFCIVGMGTTRWQVWCSSGTCTLN